MKYLFLLSILSLTTCKTITISAPHFPERSIEHIETFPMESSIRAIAAVDENTLWFAGSNGRVGHTNDGGQSWKIDSLQHEGRKLHFRAIALTEEAVFVLSIESPALLYKSADDGESWQLVYQENDPAAFYDAMAFWNDEEGIAMGDPTDGCISIIITRDGGNNWTKVPCDQLPAAAEGEAAFAASNSNIAVQGEQVWIVTGGAKARVLHSSDKGRSWSISETPIVEGGQMTGIYSVDFWDEQQGIIFGGDWNDKERNTQNKAMTADGGQTWTLLSDGAGPGYRSCVQFFPNGNGQAVLAAGIPGISISYDAGVNWTQLIDESWYVINFAGSTNACWLAGGGKIGKVKWKLD